jgi:hypothetical protein
MRALQLHTPHPYGRTEHRVCPVGVPSWAFAHHARIRAPDASAPDSASGPSKGQVKSNSGSNHTPTPPPDGTACGPNRPCHRSTAGRQSPRSGGSGHNVKLPTPQPLGHGRVARRAQYRRHTQQLTPDTLSCIRFGAETQTFSAFSVFLPLHLLIA